ncbi:flagellar protein export ATPase FliI [Scopulibacillus cellulosilyticus]|uniref:Flagellar protein export ATPase FliI n=1 Tax=Scopulibacillus cellulosilyticus TaxID=2665665 RepID=A0ABW2PXU3_9BACL
MKAVQLIDKISHIDTYKRFGKITRAAGLLIESRGPIASIGDVCHIYLQKEHRKVLAEVVGFQDEHVLLMPYNDAAQISPGCLVETTGQPLQIKVSRALIGHVCDSLGRPLDGRLQQTPMPAYPTSRQPPDPMTRPRILEPMATGIRSIDGLLTVGKGQRMGIFAGSGVGKSTLLGMIARHTSADLNVIALIGERGREVRDFIERDLGSEGLKRSIVIVATSDQPALMRIKGALTATSIAEYFRSEGQNVLLMIDSLTRVAMAQREIGLAAGEPPTTKGYPPSVFAMLPQLLERTGTSVSGSITAFYTVLVDGGDFDEPISDAARGILDGHIILDRELAQKGQYPAINILQSVSRVMNDIVSQDHLDAAETLRNYLAQYRESEDLINIGAYKPGSSKEIDDAIRYHPVIQSYLKQSRNETPDREEAINQLIRHFGKGAG